METRLLSLPSSQNSKRRFSHPFGVNIEKGLLGDPKSSGPRNKKKNLILIKITLARGTRNTCTAHIHTQLHSRLMFTYRKREWAGKIEGMRERERGEGKWPRTESKCPVAFGVNCGSHARNALCVDIARSGRVNVTIALGCWPPRCR